MVKKKVLLAQAVVDGCPKVVEVSVGGQAGGPLEGDPRDVGPSFETHQTSNLADGKGDNVSPNGQALGAAGSPELALEVEEGQPPRFGPWIVVSKNQRKRGNKVEKGGKGGRGEQGSKRKQDFGNDQAGSRFSKLGHMDDETGEKPLVEGEENLVMDEGVECLDQEMRNVKGPKTRPTRVRNSAWGKNPQLGARVRDAKKAARNIWSFKRFTSSSSGLLTMNLKENIQPTIGAGLKASGVIKEHAKDRFISLESSSTVLQENMVKTMTASIPMEETASPPLGGIGKKSGIEGDILLQESHFPNKIDGAVRTGNKLSELKTPTIS